MAWRYRLVQGMLLIAGVVMILAAAQSASAVEMHGYEDLLFTSVGEVNEAELLEDEGYVAATRGGLSVWSGEGDRSVYTRTEGMPSNLVWSVEQVGSTAYVGTEFGAAAVDVASGEVSPIDVPGVPSGTEQAAVIEVHEEEGVLHLLHRESGLATLSLEDEQWEHYPYEEGALAQGMTFVDGEVWVSFRPNVVAELDEEGAWETLFETPSRPGEMVSTSERVFVATLEHGLAVYTLEGDEADEERPGAFEQGPVHAVVEKDGTVWAAKDGALVATDEAGNWTGASIPLAGQYLDLALSKDASMESFPFGVAVATDRGLAMPPEGGTGEWVLHTSLNGPNTNVFREGTVIEEEVWFGTNNGASIFDPDRNTWRNIGTLQGLVTDPVHRIEPGEERIWFATEGAVWGLAHDRSTWLVLVDEQYAKEPGNLFYDVEPDGDTLWMPELGNGLLEHDVPNNETYRYEIPSGLLSHGLLCAERWNDYLAVCSVEAFQLFNLTQRDDAQPLGPSHDFCLGQACDGNYPAARTFTALPDGERIWTGTVDAGVVLIEPDDEEGMTVSGHWTSEEGLPSDQVRSLAPADNGVYAGTDHGLAKIHHEAGVVETWDRSDGLDDVTITGLERFEETLYVSTLSGLYRLDLSTSEFLSLSEPDAVVDYPEPEVTIEYPSAGAELAGSVNVTGSAEAPGQAIDEVHVRVDEASWTSAEGTREWFGSVDLSDLSPGEHVIEARVLSGEETLATTQQPVQIVDEVPDEANARLHHEPPNEAHAGQPLTLTASAEGTSPVRVQLRADVGHDAWIMTETARDGAVSFTLDVPVRATGTIDYRMHLQTPNGDRVAPSEGVFSVPIEPVQTEGSTPLALTLGEPADDGTLPGEPGGALTFPATVVNMGDEEAHVTIEPTGEAASWFTVSPSTVDVPARDEAPVEVTLEVPETAPAGASIADLVVHHDEEPVAHAPLTVTVLGQAAAQASDEEDEGERWLSVPASTAWVLATVVAVVALQRSGRWNA